jgi:hypothetical protein
MSTPTYEELKRFWEEVGLIVLYDGAGGVIIGRIIDVSVNLITMRDLQGLRHWISHDSITKIMELGESNLKE